MTLRGLSLLGNGVEETRQVPGGRLEAAEPKHNLGRVRFLFPMPGSHWPLKLSVQAFPCKQSSLLTVAAAFLKRSQTYIFYQYIASGSICFLPRRAAKKK